MHVHLSCFDAAAGSGWLTEAGAAAFVRATLPQLARSGCGDAFEGKLSLEDHAAIAARKLVFFHGRNSGGGGGGGGVGVGGGGGKRLRIRDVLAGRALAELLELAAPAASAPSDDNYQQQQAAAACPGGPPTNWFSAASAAAAAAAFASGAAAGVEAAAAAGLDLGEARVGFFSRVDSDAPTITSAAEAAASGSLGIPAAALCELGDGTLSPLFAARLVEERGDARALVAVFSPAPPSSPSSEEGEDQGEAEESCSGSSSSSGSGSDGENENENEEGKEEGDGGDEMNVDGQESRRRRRRRRRKTPRRLLPSLRATAGLSLPSFLDFLLAWSDRSDPKSVSWLWPALDLRGLGELSRPDVERLFEPVRRLWVERGQYDALRCSDVASEVFDIVVPDRPGFDEGITRADLCRCPMAGTVIGLLCDVVSGRTRFPPRFSLFSSARPPSSLAHTCPSRSPREKRRASPLKNRDASTSTTRASCSCSRPRLGREKTTATMTTLASTRKGKEAARRDTTGGCGGGSSSSSSSKQTSTCSTSRSSRVPSLLATGLRRRPPRRKYYLL